MTVEASQAVTHPVTPDGPREALSEARGRAERAALALRALTTCVCRPIDEVHQGHCSADWAQDVAVLAEAAGMT